VPAVSAVEVPASRDNLTREEARTRAALISNLDYTVTLTLSDDPTAKTFESNTSVTFDVARENAETFIDISADAITAVTLNGKRLEASAHGFDGNRLWLRRLRAGSNRLDVTAQCEYRHTGVGLHRLVDPTDEQVYVYTHFEPFDAHKVLACFDQPDLKGTVSIHVNAPSAWRVCSNSRVARSESAGSTNRWSFNTTPPLPPYLIAVVAGRYHVFNSKHGNIPLGIWCRESMAGYLEEQSAGIFEVTSAGLDFFSKYFDMPYPFDEYNQLFVPEFNMGAMENPGCVTFNETYVFRGQATDAQLHRRAETILHEMAHVHGFGDVATMRWWGDLWLNETFATYMSHLAIDDATRFDNTWVSFANTVKSIAARQDQLVTTHRIADDMPDTTSVRQNFDGITYHKGASVMRQLVAWVGADAFRRGVQDYFRRYRWGNATLDDFLGCLRRASGRDLSRWAREWLQTTGMNTLRAQLTIIDGDRYAAVAIEQTASEAHPTLRSHRVGIGLYDRDRAGQLKRRRYVEVDVEGAWTRVPELVGERVADLLLLNDTDLTFAKIRFDPRSLERVLESLSQLEDPLARAICWAALWDMTRDAELPTRRFVELVARHAAAEREDLLVERILSQALSAADTFGDPANRTASRTRLHGVATEQVARDDLDADLRLSWMRMLVVTASGPAELSRLEALLDGGEVIEGITVDTDLRWLVVGHLAGEGRSAVRRIAAEVKRDPTDIGRRRAAAALAARPQARAKAEAWAILFDTDRPIPRPWAAVVDREQSVATMAALMAGFGVGAAGTGGFMRRGADPELLRPYVTRYADALPAVWRTRTIDEAEVITELLYPRYLIDDPVVAVIDGLLEGAHLPAAARRILKEGRDGTLRARRAREADLAAAG